VTVAVLPVVAAVIEQDGCFLVTQRLPHVHLGGMWEFPGGKIDPAEEHDAALRRELREELGVEVTVGELVHQTTHSYPERTVALFFYRCALNGKPRAMLGQEIRWVGREELPRLGFPPADAELIDRLVRPDVR